MKYLWYRPLTINVICHALELCKVLLQFTNQTSILTSGYNYKHSTIVFNTTCNVINNASTESFAKSHDNLSFLQVYDKGPQLCWSFPNKPFVPWVEGPDNGSSSTSNWQKEGVSVFLCCCLLFLLFLFFYGSLKKWFVVRKKRKKKTVVFIVVCLFVSFWCLASFDRIEPYSYESCETLPLHQQVFYVGRPQNGC